MTETNITRPEQDRVFDEFSPKKIILQVQSVIKYTLSKWWIILIVAAIGGMLGAYRAYLKKPTYIAEVTFALDEGAAQSAKSDFAQISEQLGMGTVMDAGGVFSSVTNILELMKSRLLVEKTLRNSVNINGKSIIFADFFLDSLNYRSKWMDTTSQDQKIDFRSVDKEARAKLFENQIIRNIYETIITQFIKVSTKGQETSIIAVTCTSEHELFSKHFLEALILEVTLYYIDIKTQRAKTNVAFLQKRTDSIRNALSGSLYNRATTVDANINQVRQYGNVSVEKNQTESQIQRNTYTDLFRSLEAAKMTLMRDTPLIQYIDLPILPLKMTSAATKRGFILFFIIFGFLTVVGLIIRKVYRYILHH